MDSRFSDLFLSVCLTIVGAALAYAFVGGVPLVGIDDAAITRSYSENIARGAGYVYNVGGERVEGATSFLWVMLLTAAYSTPADPEIFILGLSFFLTAMAVFAAVRFTRRHCGLFGISPRVGLLIFSALLLASPGFFMWSVWTMMEVALWSAALLWLTYSISVRVEGQGTPLDRWTMFALAGLMPLTRPEGIAVAAGLLCLAAILDAPRWKSYGTALVIAITAFALITVFRIMYFGQPFPNTFYAKVSSDTMQGIKDGLKYLLAFLLASPLALLHVAAWGAVAAFGLLRFRQPGNRGLVVGAATVVGILIVYAGLGGDHFALWRFYQPIAPLLVIPVALGMAAILTSRGFNFARSAALAVGFLIVLGGSLMHYYQSRFDVRKEFALVERGLAFGSFLNGADPAPSIGTGPAGGIALGYDGHIYDLLGLNWPEMAHANPVKVGMRNHASFDMDTFWRHAPDVVTTFNRNCTREGGLMFWAANDDAFDDLFSEPRFRDEYVPVTFSDGEDCWPGFAQADWASLASLAGLTVFDWSDVEFQD